MVEEPTKVEVLDPDGTVVVREGKAVAHVERRPLPSLLNPLNWLLLLAAAISAAAILLYALSEVAMRRARELGYEEDDEDEDEQET